VRHSAFMHLPGLNEDGFIAREGDLARVPEAFEPVVAAVKAEITAAYPTDRLHSAYLYGSVPRGTAVPGTSDLDVLLALLEEPTDADRATASRLEETLDARFPQINGAGILLASTATLLSDLERHDLGWFVACLCAPLIGEDLCSNRHVLETPEEIERLQRLLDRSAAGAGPHMRGIITDDRRLSATQLCELLHGMRPLVVATVTADGRPLAGPVDGYFLHGDFYFSSGRDSVRMRHLAARPAVSATYLAGEELAVSVHGRAELFDVADPGRGELRRAMLDYYLPRQGPEFETWLDETNAVGARVAADKMFTFHAG
jgi:predicted nucleotidyltransferase